MGGHRLGGGIRTLVVHRDKTLLSLRLPNGNTLQTESVFQMMAGDSELLEKHFAKEISASQSSDLTKQQYGT